MELEGVACVGVAAPRPNSLEAHGRQHASCQLNWQMSKACDALCFATARIPKSALQVDAQRSRNRLDPHTSNQGVDCIFDLTR